MMIASKRLANSVQMQAMQKELLAVVDVSSTSHPDPRLQQSLEALALSLFSLSLSLSVLIAYCTVSCSEIFPCLRDRRERHRYIAALP